jgi:DNA-binding response OmpR family regulator
MQEKLPLVAIVGSDPTVVTLIALILRDLCRIEHHLDPTSLIDDEGAELPAIVLLDVDFLGSDPRGMGRRIKAACPTAATPLIYVSVGDVRTSDDGVPLDDCLATTSRPAEFRATIEARLSRKPGGRPE